MNKFFLVIILSFGIFSCTSEKKIKEKNDAEIQAYISSKGWSATKTEDGLYYIITKEGDDNHPSASSYVTVNYTGYLTNNTIFDQSTNATLPLGSVIQGWQLGIPLLERGGSGILLIPAHLAYGSQAQGNIPANAVLIFEIDLLDFN